MTMEDKPIFQSGDRAQHRTIDEGCVTFSTSKRNKLKPKEKKSKKRRKVRNGPYSSRNFLQRPKINAPANTTQFLCDDKEYDLPELNRSRNSIEGSSNNSESDSTASGSSTSTQLSLTPFDLYNDRSICDSVFWDLSDKRFMEEFENMYDDIRIELLCKHSADELTTRCVELESAVHNMQYLLHKEIDKRQKMDELLYLMQANTQLKEENERLHLEQSSIDDQLLNANNDLCCEPTISFDCAITNSPILTEIVGT